MDPKTGKQVHTTRRGFRTQKEAKIALTALQTEFDQQSLKKTNLKHIEKYMNLGCKSMKRL
ncbi:Arm DNA-binding domain-containing protein [Enterococcus mundtii]|nr:Arm DNA-binding domain-containing protein [Enterococcus mundtii]